MKIEELNPEQVGKARALATNEERLDYLKECGVELDEDILANVAGGKEISKKCQYSPMGKHVWVKSGNRREGRWLGIVDDVEYRCKNCGKTQWGLY